MGTALGVEGQTQCSLALKASLDSAAQSTLCFLRRPPCGQKRRRGRGRRTKLPQFFKKALIVKNKFFFFRISREECNRPDFLFIFFIPPVVSDSFITSHAGLRLTRGFPPPLHTPPPSPPLLETGLAVKRRPLVSSGAQHGAVIKGSRAASDPRSPKSAPPKRKEAHRGLEWGGSGRGGARDAADPPASTRSSD